MFSLYILAKIDLSSPGIDPGSAAHCWASTWLMVQAFVQVESPLSGTIALEVPHKFREKKVCALSDLSMYLVCKDRKTSPNCKLCQYITGIYAVCNLLHMFFFDQSQVSAKLLQTA